MALRWWATIVSFMSLVVAWCDGSRSHSADNHDECKEKLIAGLCYRVMNGPSWSSGVVNGAIKSPPQSCTRTVGLKGNVVGVYRWSALPAGSYGRNPGQCFASDEDGPDGRQEPVDVCKPKDGPLEDQYYFSQVQKCGHYKPLCADLQVVFANVDYPHLPGNMPSVRYIVQFDTGKYPNEECHEMIVKGSVNWGPILKGNYGCMGGCGPGCNKLGHSLDCLKHDVCSAWNALRLNKPSKGFCHDVDCGDEAGQTTWTCTSKTTGEPSECEEGKTSGKYWTPHENRVCNKFLGQGAGAGLLE